MRISTQGVYDRGATAMSRLNAQSDTLLTQISTQKRLTRASDDAAAWRQLTVIRRTTADEAANAQNVTLATNLLSASDDALAAVSEQLQRAREMATQASNGTLSDQQKAGIATSLEEMVQDLLKLANTTDVRGQPLFGGSEGSVAFTQAADGVIRFAGGGEPTAIPIGDGAGVQATVRGDRAFGSIPTSDGASDVFGIIQGLAGAIRAGGSESTTTSREAMDTLKTAIDQVADTRASVGARQSRMELEIERLDQAAVTREATRSALEDTDTATAITQLQKTMTVLQATQVSFTKLTSLSLFDYLR